MQLVRNRTRTLKWRLAAGTLGAVAAVVLLPAGGPCYNGQTLGFWLRALSSADYQERVEAEAALSRLGPEAVPQLSQALRARAGRWGWWWDRTAARLLAVRSGRPPEARIREHAALLLARLGPQAAGAVPDLIPRLTDPDSGVSRGAQVAVRRIGPDAVPALLAALASSDRETRCQILELLGDRQHFGDCIEEDGQTEHTSLRRVGGRSEPGTGRKAGAPACRCRAMTGALRDPEATVRAAAASALGQLGLASDHVLRSLEGALADPSGEVRLGAARTLGQLGPKAATAAEALAALGDDAVGRVRVEAARALWRVGGDSDLAVPVLVGALDDAEAHWQAALALGEVGPAATAAVPALLAKLEHEIAHRPARTPPSAALALARMGPEAVPGLAELLKHRRATVRVAAAHALGGHGARARLAVPGLLDLLGDPDNETRIVAANTLGAIGPEAHPAVPALRRSLEHADEYLRAAVVSALDQIGRPGASREGPGLAEPQATPRAVQAAPAEACGGGEAGLPDGSEAPRRGAAPTGSGARRNGFEPKESAKAAP